MPSVSNSCNVLLVKQGVFRGSYDIRDFSTEELLYTKHRYMDNTGRDLLVKVEGKVTTWRSTSNVACTRLEDSLGDQSPVLMEWASSNERCEFSVDEQEYYWVLNESTAQCYVHDGSLVAEVNTLMSCGRKSFTIDFCDNSLDRGLLVMITLKILDRLLYKTKLDDPRSRCDKDLTAYSIRTSYSDTSAASTTAFIK
ncbi:hypothetical protein K493DRAFT_317289 [Basidiobolus meristosporus CBS 931.73]|uniref:Uncharacterized protein n=1 Tax=Basidiobolus meristosporus CBS 931.73 TaxID=1314790 RepID=A0A1Y1Y0K2_9FUNG|nr:hypothetical protein K493DRAFT_317289 [Basidiobolus meristosporus CBS 931.73]|eukprot:ORX91425.1 hypothetical protein K493DRAFT_317289 [Basidiobolus meristosporus CBS 931.73]